MDIARLYDCSKHPDIISGRRSKEEVYKEFMKQWDTQVADGIVTFAEFMDYYSVRKEVKVRMYRLPLTEMTTLR